MKIIPIFLFALLAFGCRPDTQDQASQKSGNPLFEGWYADPEVAVFGGKYWIFPTYSNRFEKQVFFDAFSSDDLVKWEKHARILDTTAVKWAKKPFGRLVWSKKMGDTSSFSGPTTCKPPKAAGGTPTRRSWGSGWYAP